jgi:trans-aconitate methyltransferase
VLDLRSILAGRGIQGIAMRCGRVGRRWAFNQMYKSGKWLFDDRGEDLIAAIEQYAHNGHILAFGCGTASILSHLNPDAFEDALGVDLSPVAIAIAKRKYESPKIHFLVGDMLEYSFQHPVDVILFSESLNYIKLSLCEAFLKRARENLTATGRIVATIAHPRRHAAHIELVKRAFQITKEGRLGGSERYFVVFR